MCAVALAAMSTGVAVAADDGDRGELKSPLEGKRMHALGSYNAGSTRRH